MLFAGNAPPHGLSQDFNPGIVYLEVVPMEDRTLLYEIGETGPNDLELFYLGNGRRHAYTRVQ